MAVLNAEQSELSLSRKWRCDPWRHGRRNRPEGIRRLGRQVTAAFLAALVSLSGAPLAWAQATPPTEYQLKAAFLFNFAKFIDWPASSFASAQSPFSICILGKDPFGQAIDDALQGKSIGDRPVVIVRVKNVTQSTHCQIVFAANSEAANLRGILAGLRGANVLAVGESEGFAAAGGTIQFTIEENHVRFLINTDAAERAGLKFSSKLLALAKIVHDVSNDAKS
jgi:YfiR/HmsC-like